MQQTGQRSRMDEILNSYFSPEHLHADDFRGPYASRGEALLRRIETATSKVVTRAPDLFYNHPDRIAESYDNGPPKWGH
ncbi:MAG: hypothetical protein OXN96_01405 [Bryobacterales bacterium]|nr:hypothetical protein [Bryobacterales bacterium]